MRSIILFTLSILTAITYIVILVRDRYVLYKKWDRFNSYSDDAIWKKAFHDEILHQTTCTGILWPLLIILMICLIL